MIVSVVNINGTIYHGNAFSVFIPGENGYFQILDNHAPILSTLKKGMIKIKKYFLNEKDNKIQILEFDVKKNGLIEFNKNKLYIMLY